MVWVGGAEFNLSSSKAISQKDAGENETDVSVG